MADAPEQDDPEQIRLMKRMVELSLERTTMAAERTRMSADRSTMSADRSRMSAERSELSAERSYMNAERTLSVWIRTALALMIFGIAIDRFGLLLRQLPNGAVDMHLHSNDLSNWSGAALVAFGVLMAVVTGIRFLAYARAYRRGGHDVPYHHGPFLAPFFALVAALFGLVLLILMLVIFQ